ncbi:MAG: VWA domain-containing protein [Spirochaetes bacterium]|nr:VWA domain-containing protein [Spirochaetota bacterium]
MSFREPLLLLLLGPWALLALLFAMRQRAALLALAVAVAPRFRSSLTAFGRPASFAIYAALTFTAGALLLIAAAGPEASGGSTAMGAEVRPIVFVLDASFSMLSKDAVEVAGLPTNTSRLRQGTLVIGAVLSAYPSTPIALASYSGMAVLHAPFTRDHGAVRQYLGDFEEHAFEKTGSDFRTALECALRLSARPGGARCQVVLLSDGENDHSGKWDDELDALAQRGIPVHTVALGSRKGVTLSIKRPEDILAGKKSARPFKWTTAKVTAHLEKIAHRTGGAFVDLEESPQLTGLLAAIQKQTGGGAAASLPVPRDVGAPFILGSLVLFSLDFFLQVLGFFRRRRGRG